MGHRRHRLSILGTAALLVIAACAPTPTPPDKPQFERADFPDLPGWAEDDHAAALRAFLDSCPQVSRRGAGPFGAAGVWQPICAAARTIAGGESRTIAGNDAGRIAADARRFFERWFVPVRVRGTDGADGLFTGYYEPELSGSRRRGGRFTVPLYLRPPDLVSVDLGLFRDSLKGERVAGRVQDGRLVPYPDRARIDQGSLAGKGLELVWVDDDADAFFLHIQGSGRIRLDGGEIMRVGYAGSNGHVYTAVGRELIRRGAIAREDMSMQAIRRWMTANPADARRLMHTNRSFVFFREIRGRGPIGALGAPLTPGRSLAVDRRLLPLGVPVWLDTVAPDDGRPPLRRLMVAQDTGGAIRGAVRGDVFWGAGAEAERRAGHMASPGRYWFLRPRAATLAVAD